MHKNRIITSLVFFAALVALMPAQAQKPKQPRTETSVNCEYREIILKHIQSDVASREKTMRKRAKAKLLALPLEQKLYDESQVEIIAEVVDGKREDGKPELNYVLEVSYNCHHAEGIYDDYSTGSYLVEQSNSAKAICDIARDIIDDNSADIFASGKQVSVRITSSADAVDITHLPYNGEFGDHRYDAIEFNGEPIRISLNQTEGITNNAQMAYARGLAVQSYIKNNINSMRRTENEYFFDTRCHKETGSRYRRISIEFTVHGAFDQTIVDMNESLVNDEFVDYNIPTVEPASNHNTFVLIIANENYESPLPNCEYAERDGRVFSEYCVKTLGVPERHVKVINDATAQDIKREGVRWLKDIVTAMRGQADIVVYYSGHGISDADYKPYILPADVNPFTVRGWQTVSEINPDERLSSRDAKSILEQSIPLDTLCAWFNRVETKNITFILDAGFNGKQRNGEYMFNIARSNNRIKGLRVRNDIVIFSAADVNKTAYSFESQQHGFLTYFLMKELKRTKGDINYGTLYDNLLREVSYESSLQGKLQEPIIVAGGKTKDAWDSRSFKSK